MGKSRSKHNGNREEIDLLIKQRQRILEKDYDMDIKQKTSEWSSFRMKNIKGFEDSGNISIKPITIFVGRNSSGKSSTIRFPAVLAQTMGTNSGSPIHFFGDYVDYGNYDEVLHHGIDDTVETDSMAFDISIKMQIDLKSAGFTSDEEKADVVTASITVSKQNDTLNILNYSLCAGDWKLCTLSRNSEESDSFWLVTYLDNRSYNTEKMESIEFDHFLPFIKNSERAMEEYKQFLYERSILIERYNKLEEEMDFHKLEYDNYRKRVDELSKELFNVKKESSDGTEEIEKELNYMRTIMLENKDQLNELNREYSSLKNERNKTVHGVSSQSVLPQNVSSQNVINQFYMACKALLGNTYYIGPFRAGSSRTYRDPEYKVDYVGPEGKNTSTFLISAQRTNKKFLNEVSNNLKSMLGYSIRLKNMGNGLFQIRVRDSNEIESNIIDSGYGVSMVLPIVAQVLYCTNISDGKKKEDSVCTTIVEQPELHLHPAAQAELACFFAKCAVKNPRNSILIETHSEHLIRKLQVLVADKKSGLSNDMIKIYYVDKESDGVAYVSEMKLLPDGKFLNKWPEGFFDKGYQLSMELLAANEM